MIAYIILTEYYWKFQRKIASWELYYINMSYMDILTMRQCSYGTQYTIINKECTESHNNMLWDNLQHASLVLLIYTETIIFCQTI